MYFIIFKNQLRGKSTMKKIVLIITSLLALMNLQGCSNVSNQDMGTLAGGVAGGLLGSQLGGGAGKFLTIGAGTLAGAYIGNRLGQNMDENDKAKLNRTFENNAAGQPAYWTNTNTGASYKVTPTKNVTVHGNRYCREYRSTAEVAGKTQQIYGTACRQPDGSWKIQN
jgi:surface antigen